ncbi:MAG: FkbM family methyltransferase [Deltaproteobacteria bacterium]|nr:FkbM family methyltransferase [Deltaproteobacteria bacterium]
MRRAAAIAILAVAALAAAAGGGERAQRLARSANIAQRLARLRGELPEIRRRAGWSERHALIDAVADCVTTERVGRLADGGKWLCNGHRLAPPCVVYGVGAGTDISFEQAMADKFGCDVHVFDPTPSSRKLFGALESGRRYGAGKVTFHPWGLGPVSRDPAQVRRLTLEGVACEVKTLDEMAALLGHDRIDVLKMDVEGGEFPILADLLERSLLHRLRIDQLMIEFHTPDAASFLEFVRLFEALTDADYLLHRKEFNPFAAFTCAEYAFARRAYLLD